MGGDFKRVWVIGVRDSFEEFWGDGFAWFELKAGRELVGGEVKELAEFGGWVFLGGASEDAGFIHHDAEGHGALREGGFVDYVWGYGFDNGVSYRVGLVSEVAAFLAL